MKMPRDEGKTRGMILALFGAGFLAVLFTEITYTEYERFRIEVIKTAIAPVHSLISLDIQRKIDRPFKICVLNLRIKNKQALPKTIEVFLNAAKIGDLILPPVTAKEYYLEARRGILPQGEFRIDLKGGDDHWELAKCDIKNVYGYSTGLARFIIIPSTAEFIWKPSRLYLPGLFFLLFILGALAISSRNKNPYKRLVSLCFCAFLSLLAFSWLLPFFSKYRILFNFNNLLLFICLLFLAYVSDLPIFLNFLRSIFRKEPPEMLPWKKQLAAISLATLIFIFFFSISAYTLKSFKGNYSGFMRFAEAFLNERNPIFWDRSPQLIFINSDFEKGTLENWSSPSGIFHIQSIKDDKVSAKGSRVFVNNQGQYWVETGQKKKENDKRRRRVRSREDSSLKLASEPFVIQKGTIGFLASRNGSEPKSNLAERSVALVADGELVLKDTVTNSPLMELHVWDVNQWVGHTAQLVISTGINIDWFHYCQDGRIKGELLKRKAGYDGQFFYFMAYDPFLSRFKDNPRKYRLMSDAPPYRYSRIGFAWLTKLFSLDRPRLFPKTMIWLILFSHFLGAYFLVRIIQFYGQNPLWALLYMLIPGFPLSLTRALPESIAAACVLSGLYFYLKNRPLLASLLFAFSFLTRETAVIFIPGVALFELVKKKNIRNAILISLSIIPLVFWRFYVAWRLFGVSGWKSILSGSSNFQSPFSGFIELYKVILAHNYHEDLVQAATIFPIILTCIFFFSLYFFWQRKGFLSLGLLAFSLVSILLSFEKVWVHINNGIRVSYEVFLFMILVFVSQYELHTRIIKTLLLGLFALALIFFYIHPDFFPIFRKSLLPF